MVVFDLEVSHINKTWKYKYDKEQYKVSDHWKIMKEAPYVGDCEDYSLTVLYLISKKSWLPRAASKRQIGKGLRWYCVLWKPISGGKLE